MFHQVSLETRSPASGNQSRYVKAEMAGAGTYMIPMGHPVEGPLDRARLRAAAGQLVLRHDALRTWFEIADGTVTAVVDPEPLLHFHVLDLSDADFETFRAAATPLIFDRVDPRVPGSLIRVVAADYGGSWRFTIAAHHAITDGFSRGVMSRELLKLYAGEDLPPARSYYDFLPGSEPGLSEEARALVQALPNPVRLVGDGIGQGTGDDAGQVVDQAFDGLGRRLRTLGKAAGATRFGLLAAAYALALRGFSGEDRVSSYFQTEGRKALGAPNSVVGPFSNTLPLDLSVDLDRSFSDFARDLSERTRATVALETEPLLDHVLAAGKGPGVSLNMFPPASRIRAGDLRIGPREFLDRRTEFDLNMVWVEDGDLMTARAFFDRSQFTETRARLFLEFQGRLLDAAVARPDADCRAVLEAARLGHEAVVPQAGTDPAPAGRLHEAFFRTADAAPDTTAVITARGTMTYGDLARATRQVTAALQAAGVAKGDRVVILAQRDPALLSAMLGISASGASFALIDATYPPERLRWMIDRLGARVLVEAGAVTPPDLLSDMTVITSDGARPEDAVILGGPPRAEACHMFTSGTTGEPKLISHPDATLQRFVAWQALTVDPGAPIVTLMMAGLAHDPTLRDVFLPLSHGGAVAVPTPAEMARPDDLRALLARARCNVLRLSPTTARLLSAGFERGDALGSVRAIFWGGERLPHAEIRRWHDLVPEARQFNVFGTTETPQAFLVHEIDLAAAWARDIPIGKPLPWTGVRLVDDDGAPVSTGEVGEIVAQLADPVVGLSLRHKVDAPGIFHFTGDLGYRMPDGNVYYAGRRDSQVKINGFRVELGEIEATAESLPGVERACAVADDARILLFVLAPAGGVSDRSVTARLSRSLPGYMVPARVLVADAFPTTANGKIDRAALVASAGTRQAADATFGDLPATAAEIALALVYARRTGVSGVTRGASLFDLGADSLSMIEARLELERLGYALPDLWEWMPLSELALHAPEGDARGQAGLLRGHARLDTFIILRSIAIALVVTHHSGLPIPIGASLVLIAIAGFSFGRLHLPAIVEDGRTGRIWALMAKLLIPLIPASLIFFAMHDRLGNNPHPATVLLYENVAKFVDTLSHDNILARHHVEWLWFLHVYLQMFLVLGLLLAIPRVQRILATDPWRTTLVFFAISEVTAAGMILLLSGPLGLGDLLHVSSLLLHAPTTILPFFLVGTLLALAGTPARRGIALAVGLAHLGLAQLIYAHNGEPTWLIALALCLFVPYIPLPRLATVVMMALSANALMIYLSHRAVYFALDLAAPGLVPMPVSIVLQLAAGVLLGTALRPAFDWLGVNRLSNMRISFGAIPPRTTVASRDTP